ncbi:hypothetical protein EV359DRAFT_66945 [Lentinula novae-zelandiae]|nr:hypothetical protein EV359DRAFT_66945 [Lentinula novae-zelandiae]
MFIDLTNAKAWNVRTYKQMKISNAYAYAKNNGFSNSGDGDGGRKEGSQAAYVVLYVEKHCGIVAYGSKPSTSSKGSSQFSQSGQNSAPGGVKRKAADVIHSRLKPYLETELSLEDILSKYVFVVMHDEDDYNLQMTLSNPGHITLSAPQNTLLSWDTVEGTYERAQLTGSFTGVHRPGPSRLTPAELAPTRPNLRRFDFHTMVPPNWHLGKVNHAVDVVTPDYAYGH